MAKKVIGSSPEEMSASMTVFVGLFLIIGTIVKLAKSTQDMDTSGIKKLTGSMVLLSLAAASLVGLMALFKLVDAGSMLKVLGTLVGFALFMKIFGKTMDKINISGVAKLSGSMALLSIGVAALSAALILLYFPMKLIGSLDLKTIGKALLAIGGALLIFAVAGKIATLAIPGLLVLGAFIVVFTASLIALALTIGTLSTAFTILSKVTKEGAQNMVRAMKAFGEGLTAILTAFFNWIKEHGPEIIDAVIEFLSQIIIAMPVIIIKAVAKLLKTLEEQLPSILESIWSMIHSVLDSIIDNISEVGEKLIVIVEKALDVLVDAVPRIIPKLLDLLTTLIETAGNWISENSSKLVTALTNLIDSILGLVPQILLYLKDTLYSIGDLIWGSVSDGVEKSANKKMPSLIAMVLGGAARLIGLDTKVAHSVEVAYDAMTEWLSNRKGRGIDEIYSDIFRQRYEDEYTELFAVTGDKIAENLEMYEEIGKTVNQTSQQLKNVTAPAVQKARNATEAILAGMLPIEEKRKAVMNEWWKLGMDIPEEYKKALDIHSPSKVMRRLAGFTIDGLVKGIEDGEGRLARSSGGLAEITQDSLEKAVESANDILEEEDALTPVITPVLDLSQIQNGAKDINGILLGSNGQAYGAAASVRFSAESKNYLKELVDLVKSKASDERPINNTFNITGDNPEEIAEAVADIIQRQITGRERVWA